MEAGEGAEGGRGSETLSAALLPDVGLRPRQQAGLDSAGHVQGRLACPAPPGPGLPGALRVQEASGLCPSVAEGVGGLQARLAI